MKHRRFTYTFVRNKMYEEPNHQKQLERIFRNNRNWVQMRGKRGKYDYSNLQSISRIKFLMPGYGNLANKKKLAMTLQQKQGIFTPYSYFINNKKFVGGQPKPDQKGLWFLKPARGFKGEGILVGRDPDKLIKRVRNGKSYVLQKGIDNLLLLDGKKFDLRIYVLFTFRYGKPFDAYVFKDGFARKTAKKYKHGNPSLSNVLTNYNFQKGHRGYSGKTNIKLFSDLPCYNTVYQNIKTGIIDCKDILSKKLCPKNNRNGYWLAGFDFIVDANMKPWLLEVNFSPHMCLVNWKVYKKMTKPMINDLMTLAIMPILTGALKKQGGFDHLFTQTVSQTISPTVPQTKTEK